MKKLKNLLETVGVDSERLHFYNLSMAMGPRWAEMCTEFTEKINGLGPSPVWLALQRKAMSRNEDKQTV